jgi:hypothetical protein
MQRSLSRKAEETAFRLSRIISVSLQNQTPSMGDGRSFASWAVGYVRNHFSGILL